MKKIISNILICIAIALTTNAAYSESVEYTFSTGDPIYIDPLLTGLTSVSGSFIYENDAVSITTEGYSVYYAWNSLSGSANGNNFSAPLGQVIVGNDIFNGVDFFLLATDTRQNLNGFNFAELELQSVFLVWAEGTEGNPDFLDDQSLPSALPPTTTGRFEFDFVDASGGLHIAIFDMTVVAGQPAITPKLNFNGQLDVVFEDVGGGIYSGIPVGTDFSGEFDLVTALSTISDGTTVTPVTAFLEEGSFFEFENDFVLDAEAVAYLNALPGTAFAEGDLVDFVAIFADALNSAGGRIEIGLQYVLNPLTFGVDGPDSNPPNREDVLLEFFSIDERDDQDELLYQVAGLVDIVGDGEVIRLDTSNGYTDTLEPTVTIFRNDGGPSGPGNGPIRSTNIVFACGDATVADFSTGVSQIGGGGGDFCGYAFTIPREIVLNDNIFSAKSLVSGNIYEIDLHNWSEGGLCRVAGELACVLNTPTTFTYERTLAVGEPDTPSEMLGDLAEAILTINLQAGISNALDSKLDSVLAALDDRNEKNDRAALNSMYAFCNNVNAQRGKKLSESQADQLIEGANGVISSLDEFTPLCE